MTHTTTTMRLDAEAELRGRLDDRTLRCGVVGLGAIGALISQGLATAGFPVDGYDPAPEAVARFRSTSGLENATATNEPARLAGADAVVIAVRMFPGDPASPWSEPLESVGRLLAALPPRPRLVVVASTVPVGATRSFARRWAADEVTFVAHAPERLQVGDDLGDLRAVPHLIGGVDRSSTELGVRLLETYCNEAVPVASPEISELSKLLENAFRAVGIALISEVTKIAHAQGVTASDVTAAAATKPFGYFPFHPGPGVGGRCLPNDLEMLRLSASAGRISAPLLDAARGAIAEMPAVTIDRLESLLTERGVSLKGARVLVVGTGFKIGSEEQAASPAGPIVSCLRARGARPSFLDSRNDRFTVDGIDVPRTLAESLTEGMFEAALVLAGDEEVRMELLGSAALIVLDARGGATLRRGPNGTIRL